MKGERHRCHTPLYACFLCPFCRWRTYDWEYSRPSVTFTAWHRWLCDVQLLQSCYVTARCQMLNLQLLPLNHCVMLSLSYMQLVFWHLLPYWCCLFSVNWHTWVSEWQKCWLLGLCEYIVMFKLRQRFPNVWTELVGSNQVWTVFVKE